MASIGVQNMQVTLKIHNQFTPLTLKLFMLPIKIWCWIQRAKCWLFHRTPIDLDINISIG